MRPALIACLLAASAARAEDAKPLPKNIIVADLGLHVVGLGFQRMLGDHFAAQVSFNLWVPWTQNQNFLGLARTQDKGDVAGVVGRVRVFVYPEGRGPLGPWLSPFFQFGVSQQTVGGMPVGGNTLAAGAAVGWAWLFVDRIHLALGLGIQHHAAPRFSRLYTHLDINLGYAF